MNLPRFSLVTAVLLHSMLLASAQDCVASKTNVQKTDYERIENRFGMSFVRIPSADRATEHADDTDSCGADFFLQVSELNCLEYCSVLREVAEEGIVVREPGDEDVVIDHFLKEPIPIVFDYWNDAEKFIAKLNLLDADYRYRMPREEEWEYACRGEVYGEFFSTIPDLARVGGTGRLAKYENPFGLVDMLDSLAEYCSDRFRPATAATKHRRPGNISHALRGGGERAIGVPFDEYMVSRRQETKSTGDLSRMSCGLRLVLEKR